MGAEETNSQPLPPLYPERVMNFRFKLCSVSGCQICVGVGAVNRKSGVTVMNVKRNVTIAILGLGFALVTLNDASAAAAHPRRAEVNGRLAVENARINRNLAKGNITPQEATALHSEVRGVRAEERLDASQHGGHITKAEQHQLNQQENGVSKQIYQTAH
jgi:hypothetical protein